MSTEQPQNRANGSLQPTLLRSTADSTAPGVSNNSSSVTLNVVCVGKETQTHKRSPVSPTDKSLDTFYEKLFAAITTASTFGGGLAFTRVIDTTDVVTNKNAFKGPFRAETVHTFLALGWFLFTANICLSGACTAAVHFKIRGKNKHKRNLFHHYANHVAALYLTLLLVAALLFECLAVVAYTPHVGWVATAFVSAFGFGIVIWWIMCLCKHWKDVYSEEVKEGWLRIRCFLHLGPKKSPGDTEAAPSAA